MGRVLLLSALMTACAGAPAEAPEAPPPGEHPVDGLFRRLASDDIEEREEATLALIALGHDGVPRMRERLRSEADPEIRRRLERALETALRIRVELAVRGAKPGEAPQWSVRLVNASDRPVGFALYRAGYTASYPRVRFEAIDPTGAPVRVELTSGGGIQRHASPLTTEVIPPEGEVNPFGLGTAHDVLLCRWRPIRPGRYRVRFVYDSSDEAARAWLAAACDLCRTRETTAALDLLFRARIMSDWVEFEVAP